MTIAAFVDCETTRLLQPSVADLDKQPKIIELGIILVEGGRIVEERDWLVDPGETLEAIITKITGLTDAQLAGKPGISPVLSEFAPLLARADSFWAHNAEFDKQVIMYEALRHRVELRWPAETVCTVQEYVHEFGFRPKLTQLYERKMGKELVQTHRALDDIRAMVEICLKEGLV